MDLVIYDLAARLAATILNAAFYFIYDIVKIHYKVSSIKHFEHYTSKVMAHLTLNLSGATASHDASPIIKVLFGFTKFVEDISSYLDVARTSAPNTLPSSKNYHL